MHTLQRHAVLVDSRCAFLSSIRLVMPLRVSSRKSFSLWVCEQHNAVNAKLGKPEVPCDARTLDARWRTGGPHCGGGREGAQAPGENAQESLGQ